MSSDPFLLPPQSVVSFSGGRTSGLMLRRILDAHGGTLPPDRVVIFCNTGKEREETLEFVERVSLEWSVPIAWLEYAATPSGRLRKRDGKVLWTHTFREVSFATASRNGEPFENAIATRGYLPNPTMRYCTGELKIKTTNRHVRFGLGWPAYFNAIGFRHDEPQRVAGLVHLHRRAEPGLFDDDEEPDDRGPSRWNRATGETPLCPLYEAGLGLDDVREFWSRQPFDLALRPDQGNCDACFLKTGRKLVAAEAERPGVLDWWAERERLALESGVCKDPKLALFRDDRPGCADLKLIASGARLPGELNLGPVAAGDGRDCSLWDDCRCTD